MRGFDRTWQDQTTRRPSRFKIFLLHYPDTGAEYLAKNWSFELNILYRFSSKLTSILLVFLLVNNRWVFCAYRGTLRVPREAASAPPTGPLQRTREARRQRERPAAALLRPHAHADHRRGQHSYHTSKHANISHHTSNSIFYTIDSVLMVIQMYRSINKLPRYEPLRKRLSQLTNQVF